jgi:microcystin-dependent protein
MKTIPHLIAILGMLILADNDHADAQGTTAFTYQGHLNTSGNAANGFYNLSFAVYDASVAGNLIAGPITNSEVAVSNGLFTVTLDFGSGVFTGTNYWVQMAVSPIGSGTFATLSPRQQLTPAPYAISLMSPQATALCPPGSVIAYMGASAPPGWLLCDGSAVSRTQYPALWVAIGTNCGAGNLYTTFNLPDMRGVFLRGVNGSRSDSFADPDTSSASRNNIFQGGNTGNAVGSYQADQFASHSHPQVVTANPGYGTGIRSDWTGDGATFGAYPEGVNTGTAGGNETRPKNVYVNYIIKY